MSKAVAPRGNRITDKAANVAVAVVLVISALHLIGALMSLGEPSSAPTTTGVVLAGVANLAMLIGYLVLVLRAPTTLRWVYLALLTAVVLFATGSSLASNDGGKVMEVGASSVVSLLVITAVMCLPAVYMRLRTPKSALARH